MLTLYKGTSLWIYRLISKYNEKEPKMRKTSLSLIVMLALMVFALTACTSKTTSLPGTSWSLVSYGPVGKQTAAVSGIATHLKFGTDGNVSGSMGCNSFGGTYTLKGDTITFGPIASTMMACPDAQMTQESDSFQIMNGTVKFEQGDGSLTIFSADGTTKMMLEGLMTAN